MAVSVDLIDGQGKVVGKTKLPAALEGDVNSAVLWQAVRSYRANQRQGTADTKTRAEVRGGGRKPWRQKHTGRARHGSIRSPIWRGGGVTFGPHPRDYSYHLSGKIRKRALLSSIRAKVADQALLAVETLDLEPKTKALSTWLKSSGIKGSALLVTEKHEPNLVRISRNMKRVSVSPVAYLNCYDVLAHRQLILTQKALEQLEKQLP